METVAPQDGLAAALADQQGLVGAWVRAFEASRVRLPGSYDADLIRHVAGTIVSALAEGMPAELAPGSPALRGLEQAVGFAAANWAVDQRSGFDLIALLLAGRDVIYARAAAAERGQVVRLFEWLAALATESFGDAGVRTERERQREALERGTPVALVAPEVPAALLVGQPDSYTLDGVLGRLMMLVVRVGAKSAIIDATGMAEPGSAAAGVSLQRFFSHRKLAGQVTVHAVGLDAEAEASWGEISVASGASLVLHASFDRALAAALERTEYRLVRRPS